MKILKHLPNALTSANLVCGVLAVIEVFTGSIVNAVSLVFLALVFDFLDGFVARLLKVSSPIGKDLDSLADMVTFGVVPGTMLYKMLWFSAIDEVVPGFFWSAIQSNTSRADLADLGVHLPVLWTPFVALLVPVFSALRLAKFNNDARQSDTFIGVPTPANTILIASLVLNFHAKSPVFMALSNTWVLLGITLVCSYALVAELPLLALKFKDFSWKNNQMRYLLVGLTLVLLATLQVQALPLVIPVYILLSLVNNIFFKAQH